jgi:hypothetical protein
MTSLSGFVLNKLNHSKNKCSGKSRIRDVPPFKLKFRLLIASVSSNANARIIFSKTGGLILESLILTMAVNPFLGLRTRFVIMFLAILVACGPEEKEFELSTWNEMDDLFYANRESMVRDLMDNHLHIRMSYGKLTELIGKPENYSNMKPDVVADEIMVDYGWDIDPVEGKTLVISLSKDSTITGYKLEHWKH